MASGDGIIRNNGPNCAGRIGSLTIGVLNPIIAARPRCRIFQHLNIAKRAMGNYGGGGKRPFFGAATPNLKQSISVPTFLFMFLPKANRRFFTRNLVVPVVASLGRRRFNYKRRKITDLFPLLFRNRSQFGKSSFESSRCN